jgi:hypothetical protein
LAATGLAGLLSLAVYGARAQDEWSYEVTPFLWAASLDGRVSFSGAPVEVAATFQDLVDLADIGAAMRITAHRPPVGWYGEASWIETTNPVASSSGTVALNTTQTFAEAGLLYEVNPAFAVYGGLRYQDIDSKLDTSAERTEKSEAWIDGIVGARWTPLTSENWVAWGRADIGGGGSDLVWLAEVGGGYRWGTSWGAYVAYRILDTDYEHATFLYDVQQSGLLLGFGFRY